MIIHKVRTTLTKEEAIPGFHIWRNISDRISINIPEIALTEAMPNLLGVGFSFCIQTDLGTGDTMILGF